MKGVAKTTFSSEADTAMLDFFEKFVTRLILAYGYNRRMGKADKASVTWGKGGRKVLGEMGMGVWGNGGKWGMGDGEKGELGDRDKGKGNG